MTLQYIGKAPNNPGNDRMKVDAVDGRKIINMEQLRNGKGHCNRHLHGRCWRWWAADAIAAQSRGMLLLLLVIAVYHWNSPQVLSKKKSSLIFDGTRARLALSPMAS